MGAARMDMFGGAARALGRALRGRGMAEAEAHADAVHDGWSDMVDEAVRAFAKAAPPSAEFTAADIRVVAEAAGVPPPPDLRAWGSAMRRARADGLIKAAGVVKSSNPTHHRGYITSWARAI